MTDTQDTPSLPSYLMLGALTSLVNQSMTLVEGAQELLHDVDGLVVRLRLEKPSAVLYILFHDDGIECLQESEGKVDVRIHAPLGALLQYLLIPDSQHLNGIHWQGEEPHLKALGALLEYCSFSAVARGWLDRYVRFNDLLSLLSREDPAWLARLQGLPEDIQQLAKELAQQRLLQEDILQELQQWRQQFHQQRRMDILCMVCGLILLLLAMVTLNGNLPQWFAHQALLLSCAGGALLLSRLAAA